MASSDHGGIAIQKPPKKGHLQRKKRERGRPRLEKGKELQLNPAR